MRSSWRLLLLLGASAYGGGLRAEFGLNFQIKNQGSGYNDGYWSSSVYHSVGVENWAGDETLTNQTPWVHTDNWHLPELVYDPNTGLRYYHVLFGSMADGFMQEYFIQVATANYGTIHPAGKDQPGSASTGEGNYHVLTNGVLDNKGGPAGGNGADPLDTDPNVDSGNGSGNPRKIIMRQIINTGEIMMEFLKDGYLRKPRISQLIQAPDMTQMVDMDMRAISYDDTTSKAKVTNQTWLWGQGVPDNAAYFDAVAKAENTNVNAGQYSYTDGLGTGGAAGVYSYTSGSFDHVNQNWADFIDLTISNPWSFEKAKQW